MLLKILLTTFIICSFVYSMGTFGRDEYALNNVRGCLYQITEKEFELNPLGFMIVPKTTILDEPADSAVESYLQYIFSLQKTTIMTVADDSEDAKWRRKGGIYDKQTQDESLEHDVVTNDSQDEIIQTYLALVRLSEFYIIIVDSFRLFNSKIRQLAEKPSWNATARVVVYCSQSKRTKKGMMMYPTSILHALWSTYNVMNAVVLVHDFKNHAVINIYSWKPYDPPSRCGEKDQDLSRLVELYDTCENGILTRNNDLFPCKIPQNLKGCRIKVLGVIWHPFVNHNTSHEDEGIEREILNVIAERLNFTVDINTSENTWGSRAHNGTWSGMMGALKKGKGEVAIGAVYPDNKIHEDFDSTLSYLQDSYIWIVPRAQNIPKWKNLVIILGIRMWITTLAVFLICTFVWYLMGKSPFENGIRFKNFVPALLDSYCMQLCISTVSKPLSHSMRIYYVAFALYSMVWCTVYQTKLIIILTHPLLERQITQPSELLESNLKFGGNGAFRYLFNNSIDGDEDHFYSNYLELDIHEMLDEVIKYRNLSILTSKLYVKYLSATTTHYNDKHGHPMFYNLHSNVFSFPVEMVTIKGFAFLERFNFFITLFKSNGLLKRTLESFAVRSSRRAANLARDSGVHEMDSEQVLNISHLQGAFIVLTLGLLTGLLTLVAELIFFRHHSKKKNI